LALRTADLLAYLSDSSFLTNSLCLFAKGLSFNKIFLFANGFFLFLS
jgi:hypothetical protein